MKHMHVSSIQDCDSALSPGRTSDYRSGTLARHERSVLECDDGV
jgi:hypothetical protein